MEHHADRVLDLARRTGVVRARDLVEHHIPRVVLQRLERRGLLTRAGRGLYILPDADITQHHTIVEACKRVPHGVVCLLSVLVFHGLTTQAPFEVWMAVDGRARRPHVDHPPLRVVGMTGLARTTGVEEHVIEGVTVRVYSAAKTVADCFRFRNKIGHDVAIEALRDYMRSPRKNVDELWRCAQACRVLTVLRPYVEALA
jgi:predicted transcriptional regulator of viral defense system